MELGPFHEKLGLVHMNPTNVARRNVIKDADLFLVVPILTTEVRISKINYPVTKGRSKITGIEFKDYLNLR